MFRALEKIQRLERKLEKWAPIPASQHRSIDLPAVESELLSFLCRVSPSLTRPDWFAPYAAKLEEARTRPVRVVFSAPPQHGKTEVTKHAVPWHLAQADKRHAYITYASERAQDVSSGVQHIASSAGLVVEGSLRHWRVRGGGGSVLWTGIGGPLTGYGIDGLMVVDDPIKNREDADSKVRRERAYQWFKDVALTRLHQGASCIVMATRWHPDDLSGRLIDEGWEWINLPALAEGDNDPLGREMGQALAEPIWPREVLDERKREVGDFTWSALYQGRPRPRGGQVFHEPSFYRQLPRSGYRGAFGLDLAYTAKTSADWSVLVEMVRAGETYYVVDVIRRQVEAPSFALALKARHVKQPRYRMRWRASGTEAGAAGFLKRQGLPIDVVRPKGDKFVCATPYAAAWNDCRVLLPDPEEFPWSDEMHAFAANHADFTGIGDESDDDVDAGGAAFDALQTAGSAYGSVRGHKRGMPKPRE